MKSPEQAAAPRFVLRDTNVSPGSTTTSAETGRGAAVHHEHDFDLPGLRSGRCDSRRKFDWSVSHREDNHGDWNP